MRSSSFLDDFKFAWSRPGNLIQRLIIINVAVFMVANLAGLFVSQGGTNLLLANIELPMRFSELLLKPWTLFTYFFTHMGVMHIFWNMITLYWFGTIFKEYLGQDRLLILYILGGIVGGLLPVLLHNTIPFYIERNGGHLIGASASVMAIVVGIATYMPNFSLNMLLLGPVRLKYIALVVVFLSVIGVKGLNAGGELAHLGGAAMGYFFIKQLQAGREIGKWILNFLTFIKSFFVKQPPHMKVNYSSRKGKKSKAKSKTAGGRFPSTPDQEEIDAILDKISQSGYESLSKEEKQKLFNASKNN